jgi:hypothetical protein
MPGWAASRSARYHETRSQAAVSGGILPLHFDRGARGGVSTALTPSLAKTSSNMAVTLVSRSQMRSANRSALVVAEDVIDGDVDGDAAQPDLVAQGGGHLASQIRLQKPPVVLVGPRAARPGEVLHAAKHA